ncbi:MAG: DMT family transporter [Rhodospirillales bacterium]
MDPAQAPAVPAKGRTDAVRGILWMLLASLCFAGMHAVIKKVSLTGIHPFETAFFRLLFGMLPIIPFFIKDGLKPLKTKRLGLLTLRGVLNSAAMMCYFFALSIAPLAQVTALGFSAPIFASVLAVLFLGEVIRLRRWTAILLGFAGTLVILRPGLIPLDLGPMLVVISSLIWGGCMIIIKRLSATESSATITVYMSLVMMPIILVPASFVWSWPGPEQWALLIGLGILGGGAQLSMAQALKMADTHVVGPVDFVRLIWVTALGYIFFNELPDMFVWIGGAMILGSTAYIAYREHRLGRAQGIVAGPPGARTTIPRESGD